MVISYDDVVYFGWEGWGCLCVFSFFRGVGQGQGRGGAVVVAAGLSMKITRQSKTPHDSLDSLTPSKLCGAIPQFLPMLTKRSVCKLAPLQPTTVFCTNVPKSLVLSRRAPVLCLRPALRRQRVRRECFSKSHHSSICIPEIWTICLLLWYKNKLNFIY